MFKKALGALLLAAVCACGGDKEQATLALDEGRLAVEAARKAGAASSSKHMAAAERELALAEKNYGEARYGQVKYPANRATDAARLARSEASAKPAAKAGSRRKRAGGGTR
jgi:hypothetical protein